MPDLHTFIYNTLDLVVHQQRTRIHIMPRVRNSVVTAQVSSTRLGHGCRDVRVCTGAEHAHVHLCICESTQANVYPIYSPRKHSSPPDSTEQTCAHFNQQTKKQRSH